MSDSSPENDDRTYLGDLFKSKERMHPAAVLTGVSVAIVDPLIERKELVLRELSGRSLGAVTYFASYSTRRGEARALIDAGFDVVFVGMDGDTEIAFRTVEELCSKTNATVMLYSANRNEEMLMRGMRAGAREFFSYPFEPGVVDDAMARVVNRISLVGRERKERFVDEAAPVAKRTPGKLLVFCGAKGGAGVTTVATNFAVALAMGSTKPTALVDLNLPLGDAGLNLGLNNQYSTLDALNNINRLDTTYLAALMVRHSSGMSVLAAPGMHAQVPATRGATDKLISVAREAFDYVVVDVGSNWSWIDSEIFDQAEIIYLISQIGIPELRNSNRVITGGLAFCAEKIQVVLNRYEPKMHLLARPDIEKALTRPASWKIPSDYATVYDMQTGAKPLVQEDCQISRVIWAMAEKAGDLKLPVQPERNIFGFSKRVSRIYSVGAAK